MKNLLTLALCCAAFLSSFGQNCNDLFISEYIEGSSSNKAFEIFNPTNSTVDLTDYVIYRANNGSTTPTDSIFPQGNLASGDVFAITNPSASLANIVSESDTIHSITFYNGDDALILMNKSNGDTLDVIGIVGVDPGSGWTVGTGATNNFTLVRHDTIVEGTTDWNASVTQWDIYPIDTDTYFGSHTINYSLLVDFSHAGSLYQVNFSSITDPNSTVQNMLWDFGDGNTSTQSNPIHNYAAAGVYTVCLTVTDLCMTDSTCHSVNVICNQPEAGFSQVVNNLTVNYTDTSSTTNTILNYLWDFGDGNTSTQINPVHTYAAHGVYTVCLTVSDSCGTDSTCHTVIVSCTMPTIDFTHITNNYSASFTDASTTASSFSNYLWDFGDGNTSAQQNPVHNYAAVGTYTVCLTATDACGTDSTCHPVNISCVVPTADFTFTDNFYTVDFTDASTTSNTILNYLWDFGDGSTSTASNPTHTYITPGTYTACLTVTDSCGTDSTCQTVAIVCDAPIAAFEYTANDMVISFNDTSVSSSGITSWFWDFGDGSGTSTSASPTYTYTLPALYTICLTVEDICGTDSICYEIAATETGINEPLNNAFTLYPNPTSNEVNLDLTPYSGKKTICIFNAVGQEVYHKEHTKEGMINLDLSDLPNGNYWIKVHHQSGVTKSKLQINK